MGLYNSKDLFDGERAGGGGVVGGGGGGGGGWELIYGVIIKLAISI